MGRGFRHCIGVVESKESSVLFDAGLLHVELVAGVELVRTMIRRTSSQVLSICSLTAEESPPSVSRVCKAT